MHVSLQKGRAFLLYVYRLILLKVHKSKLVNATLSYARPILTCLFPLLQLSNFTYHIIVNPRQALAGTTGLCHCV